MRYFNNRYVDADRGDDANSGLTVEQPLKTLKSGIAATRNVLSATSANANANMKMKNAKRYLVLRGRHYLVRELLP